MNREKTVFLDTSALIPLLTECHSNHNKVRRYLREIKGSYCIDSIVLSEFLTKNESPEIKRRYLEIIAKEFRVFSLSTVGAQIGASIFCHLLEKNAVPKGKMDRQITRVDVLVLASAIENRVDTLLYEDKHFSFMVNNINDLKIPRFFVPELVQIQDIPNDLFDRITS
jgi:predicted nucleic acid-binding protein